MGTRKSAGPKMPVSLKGAEVREAKATKAGAVTDADRWKTLFEAPPVAEYEQGDAVYCTRVRIVEDTETGRIRLDMRHWKYLKSSGEFQTVKRGKGRGTGYTQYYSHNIETLAESIQECADFCKKEKLEFAPFTEE